MSDDTPIMQITLHQPFASLIAIRQKGIETRNWGTKYKGWVAIHAGKNTYSIDLIIEQPFFTVLHRHLDEDGLLPLGCIVALVWLNECIVSPGHVPAPYLQTTHEAAFGDFTKGRKLWIFDRSTVIRTPNISAVGQRGIQHVDPQLYPQLRSLIR